MPPPVCYQCSEHLGSPPKVAPNIVQDTETPPQRVAEATGRDEVIQLVHITPGTVTSLPDPSNGLNITPSEEDDDSVPPHQEPAISLPKPTDNTK